MKNFLKFVYYIAYNGSLVFTAMIIIFSVIDMLIPLKTPYTFDKRDLQYYWINGYYRMRTIWQLLMLAIAIAILRYVFFSGQVMKKSSYLVRMAGFGVLCLGVCVGTAVLFRWFYLDSLIQWGKFLLTFLVGFVGLTAGFEVYFRIEGKRYDAALGRRQVLADGKPRSGEATPAERK